MTQRKAEAITQTNFSRKYPENFGATTSFISNVEDSSNALHSTIQCCYHFSKIQIY